MPWPVKKLDQFESRSGETKNDRRIKRLIHQAKNGKTYYMRKVARKELAEKYGIKIYNNKEIRVYEEK
jgi:hypothetical protein